MTNPLGQYGSLTAAVLAIVLVVAAVASHIIAGLVPSQWLDTAGTLAAGVVFGTQVVQNGTQTAAKAALALGTSVASRVDALEAATGAQSTPPAPPAAPGL